MKHSKQHIEKFLEYRKAEIFTILLIISCMIPNLLVMFRPGISAAYKILNIALPLAAYLLILSLIKKTGWNVAIMLPAMFMSAFQTVLFCMNGESVISVDMWLNIPTTNSGEIRELLHSMIKAVVIIVIIFTPLILTGIMAIVHKWTTPAETLKRMRKLSLLLLMISLPFIIVLAHRHDMSLNNIFPLNALENFDKAVKNQIHVDHQQKTSEGFRFSATSHNDSCLREIHVLVIGETSRADNWGIMGYERATTSALDTVEGLAAFPNVLSQSNTTHKSVPLLLSHLDAQHYGDSIHLVKGLVSAFREAGFKTVFLSSQQRNHSYIDFFGEEADTCIFIRDYPESRFSRLDTCLINLVRSELSCKHTKQFIVLHTYGSHFNYGERYCEKDRTFIPDKYESASPRWRQEMVNAYDNSIVATSKFLMQLIEILKKEDCDATLTYTSDHGEDIFDDG